MPYRLDHERLADDLMEKVEGICWCPEYPGCLRTLFLEQVRSGYTVLFAPEIEAAFHELGAHPMDYFVEDME